MEKAKAGDLFARTPEIHKLETADKLPNNKGDAALQSSCGVKRGGSVAFLM
jgi:hypothetical protein